MSLASQATTKWSMSRLPSSLSMQLEGTEAFVALLVWITDGWEKRRTNCQGSCATVTAL